jgi:hypothetical protein
MQTSFIDWPQEPDAYLESILGPKRAGRLNPLRTYVDAGIVVSAGSDAPCTDPDPVLWMQRACNHSNPAQSLTVREALRMCTYNGAWATFDGELEVEQLLLAGTPYEKQRQNFLAAVLKGMVSKSKI